MPNDVSERPHLTMATVRITCAEAIVRYLIAQRIEIDGQLEPLFPGVMGIFGHGNVTSLGHSLERHRDEIPVYRGQNEQGMGLAAAAFAKATRRRQILVCTSSVGPGATNMVTAAGVAMANRLPVLFIAGDTFNSRLPDPVLQQVEHFGSPSSTVNDAFKAVVRYWDRITDPAQVLSSLPHLVGMFLDPGECGPAFLGLPQDVAAMAYNYPAEFFEPRIRTIPRSRTDETDLATAAHLIRSSQRPVLIAGGGVHYSLAEAALAKFAQSHGLPVVETVAGKSSLLATHPWYAGPLGVTGAEAANAVVSKADLVIAVGTRLQDFTTGSWTVFNSDAKFVSINAARFDALKHGATAVVADARETLDEISTLLDGWHTAEDWGVHVSTCRNDLTTFIAGRIADDGSLPLSYAQVVGAVHSVADEQDYVLTAAGGLPGELTINWLSKGIATFDCEYGFSCMGYEISGAWGAAMARPDAHTFALVGDGSYLMLNSDIYSSILSGHKFILVVCDNAGFAVIERLQVGHGGNSYNNMLRDSIGPGSDVRVDFRAHAAAMGAHAAEVSTLDELANALTVARTHERTSVIVVKVRESDWTEGGAFWQVGVPEVSDLASVRDARTAMDSGLTTQRRGI
jgi:3D-(3,5/4)-trihydroxycyclohexane-1,2-dione acylhydrolase (decyclizing)